jgi:two-component system, NtrC family, response regulator AtoC
MSGPALALVRTAELSESARPPAFSPCDGVVVVDPTMHALYAQVTRAALSSISVLLLGETGVGKGVLARAIHDLSPRRGGPFVALNCAALSESLLQSELFGHERGAFTGALQAHAGLLEAADGGSVFLDEIGELPVSIQAKVLRAVEDRKVLRIGARTEREVDVRFIAATHRDLEAEADAGTFRQDLFYRLNGISFTIPPLRERRAEIRVLCGMFLARYKAELGRSTALSISPEALSLLEGYPWPGNVRELRNVVERGAVLCAGDELHIEHLPLRVLNGAPARPPATPPSPDRTRENVLLRARNELQALERERITLALEQCGGNQTRAAQALGVSRRTLVSRLSALDVPRPRKR